ncbi:MAG TPA: FCD domain-containing protein [Solirubrobacterales bacterium]|jgi:DNA-binding FadR family transcriptional regulator|nr:FCD domain-containing protein [Solirubrobacterales bacterium]
MEASFEPVGPRRTFEGAVAQIADRIRLGELERGDRLPSERDLAAAMQISRPTLREAVRVLDKAGVLDVRKGARGGIYVVSEFVPLDLVRTQSDLRLQEVGGVLEARRLVEPRVAQLASTNARDEDFKPLRQIIDTQARMVENGEALEREDEFLQLDTRFHLRLARASGNTTIVSIMRALLRQLEIVRDLAMHEPPTAPWVVDIHERTLAAIRAGDPELIERVMDEHLAAMEDAWERSGGRALVRSVPDFLLSSARSAPKPGWRD